MFLKLREDKEKKLKNKKGMLESLVKKGKQGVIKQKIMN